MQPDLDSVASARPIFDAVTDALLAIAVLGIIAGALLGAIGANRLVDALDSDLIHLVRHIDTATYLLAGGAVLVATALALGISLATGPSRDSPE